MSNSSTHQFITLLKNNASDKYPFNLQLLSATQGDRVLSLYQTSSDYFIQASGQVATYHDVDELFESLPSTKKHEDKFIVGITDKSDKIVGVVDLIRDYPRLQCWCLGFMLIAPQLRNHRYGSAIYHDIESMIYKSGGKEMRLVVHDKNLNALRFWQHIGFSIKGTGFEMYGDHKAKVFILEKTILQDHVLADDANSIRLNV